MGTKPFTFNVQPAAVQPPPVTPPPVTPPSQAVQVVDETSTASQHQFAYQNGVLTITDGVTPPPLGPIQIGSTVKALASPTNVRTTPGGPVVAGTVPAGTQGTVTAGPQTANGFPWWTVKFPSVTGWVGYDSLQVVANPNPPVTVGASFPGAQGSGAAAAGGRGGVVIEVTNLNDSGPGSFRAACAAPGARYVVFRVGGIIPNFSDLRIGNPFITVLGRTAPGGGITVGGKQQSGVCLFVNCPEVILLDLTYDGSAPTPTGPSTGTVGFQIGSGNIYNVVFAFLSARWQGNKNFLALTNDAGPVKNVTVQRCLSYEPNAQHPVGPMTDATSGPAINSTDIDFHHNLIINTGHRIPLFNTRSGRWQNNIVFNWDYFASLFQGGVLADIIGNFYVRGNLNAGNPGQNGTPHPIGMTAVQSTDDTSKSMPGPGSFYIIGNYDSRYLTDPNGDQTLISYQTAGEGLPEIGPIPAKWLRSAQLPAPKYPIIDDSARNLATLENSILPTVGNSIQLNGDGSFTTRRDPEDQRVIAQYIARGPGNFYTGQFASPAIANGTPWISSRHDGIADQWKQLHDLDTSDPNLYKTISPNAGIPYIECFAYGVKP